MWKKLCICSPLDSHFSFLSKALSNFLWGKMQLGLLGLRTLGEHITLVTLLNEVEKLIICTVLGLKVPVPPKGS